MSCATKLSLAKSDLPTENVLVPATIFLARQGGRFPSDTIKRRFIRWLYLAGLWARYSGSAETKLQQDVALVAGSDIDPTHELETAILRERGRVALEEGDLDRARINSAVALLSHVVARSRDASDWFTGARIYDAAVGKSLGDERHYIFPRTLLKNAGIQDPTRINAVANRALLGERPSLALSQVFAYRLPARDRRTISRRTSGSVGAYGPRALGTGAIP